MNFFNSFIYLAKIVILPIILLVIWIRNYLIQIRYRRGKIIKHDDFEIKRSRENKSGIYIIVKDKYHHVINEYTLKKLGFDSDEVSKEDGKCFSKSDYENKGYAQGKDIQIYKLGEFRKNYLKVFEK